MGEIAHIRSPRPLGPRYDPDYPRERANDFENLLILCPLHHKIIDDLERERYPTSRLTEIKAAHESAHEHKDWAPDDLLTDWSLQLIAGVHGGAVELRDEPVRSASDSSESDDVTRLAESLREEADVRARAHYGSAYVENLGPGPAFRVTHRYKSIGAMAVSDGVEELGPGERVAVASFGQDEPCALSVSWVDSRGLNHSSESYGS